MLALLSPGIAEADNGWGRN